MNKEISELGHAVGTRGEIFTRSRLISKYQALKLAQLLYHHHDVADQIIQGIFYYAMAIKNDKFVCPKYVRII